MNLTNNKILLKNRPFGMAMGNRKFTQTSSSYRYGFSGKEKDKEINADDYDFGARMLDSRLARWLSIDPLSNKYPSLCPYNFVANTPLQAKDPDGELIIFVNGYWNSGNPTAKEIQTLGAGWPILKKYLADNLIGNTGGRNYWGGSRYEKAAQKYFNDYASLTSKNFVDGRGKWSSTGQERYDAGYAYAKANFGKLTAGMTKNETIKIVSHSMGGAYSEGMVKYFEENGKYKVEKVLHLSMADSTEISLNTKPQTIQLNYDKDVVLGYKNFDESSNFHSATDISGVANVGDYGDSHALTKSSPGVFDYASDLESIKFSQEMYEPWHSNGDYSYGTGNYIPSGNTNGSVFKEVIKADDTSNNKKQTYKKNSSNSNYHQ